MKWFSYLERRLRPLAVEHITLAIVFLQGLCYVFTMARPQFAERIVLIPNKVLSGEVWRLFTCVLTPPPTNPLFLFFALYMFWMMGSALENHWGALRYNLYLLIGYVASVALAFAAPHEEQATVIYLQGSVFLAFACLYPDFTILVFFILPVKVKWLALLTWIGYAAAFIGGDVMARLLVVASVINFFIFFGRDILFRSKVVRDVHRHVKKKAVSGRQPFHTCAACGVTDVSNHTMEFRYCPQCAGTLCYCIEHIAKHEHRGMASG